MYVCMGPVVDSSMNPVQSISQATLAAVRCLMGDPLGVTLSKLHTISFVARSLSRKDGRPCCEREGPRDFTV